MVESDGNDHSLDLKKLCSADCHSGTENEKVKGESNMIQGEGKGNA